VKRVETTDIDKFKTRTKDAVRVLAFFRARQGRGPELEKVLLDLVGPTRSEPGNISYVLHRKDGEPDALVFDEIWASRKALEEHAQKPYILSLGEKIKGLADGPPRVEVYFEVRAGT
jgi:quinol monooxygenase YgiN